MLRRSPRSTLPDTRVPYTTLFRSRPPRRPWSERSDHCPPRGDVMATLLYRLAHWCVRRRRIVLAAWLTALIGAVALAVVADGEASSAFEMPGTESQAAADLLADRFPSESGSTARIVFNTPDGPSPDQPLFPVATKTERRRVGASVS